MGDSDSYDSVDDYSENDNDDYRESKIQDKVNSLYNYSKLCYGCKRMFLEISRFICQQCKRYTCRNCWRPTDICESCRKEKTPVHEKTIIVCDTIQ